MKLKSKKLNTVVDNFCEAMKSRLAEKEAEGYTGWNNRDDIEHRELIERANSKIFDIALGKQVDKNTVDVANFMMMVYFRKQKRVGKV